MTRTAVITLGRDGIRVQGTEESDPAADRELVREALIALWERWCGGEVAS